MRALPAQAIIVQRSSSVYETEPVGLVLDQRDFLNACLEVETERGPEELLDACKEVEREVGRAEGTVRHGPRVIDVDVLLLGSTTYASARLTLPHPELRARRFVLAPLLELDASVALPDGTRLLDCAAALGSAQQVSLVGEPLELS